MKIFSVDSGLYKFLLRFLDMIKLNFLWLLFSLPIVTMGAATVAAYSVTLKMVEDKEGYIGRTFLKAFKANWKKGIPLGLLGMLAAYAIYLDFQLFKGLEGSVGFLIVGVVGIFVFLFSFLYAFALMARYENSLGKTLRNSMDIAVRYLIRTVFLVLLLVVEVMLFMFNSTTLFFGILIGPACLMLTVSGFAIYFFREIEREPGAVSRKIEEEE